MVSYSLLNLLQKDWPEIYQDIIFLYSFGRWLFTPLISTPPFFQNIVYIQNNIKALETSKAVSTILPCTDSMIISENGTTITESLDRNKIYVVQTPQSFKFDLFVKDPKGPQAKALLILLTLAIGSLVGNFLINYLEWASWIKYLLFV